MSAVDFLKAKIERAREQIRELELALNVFLFSSPYELATRIDTTTGEHVYYLAKIEDIPLRLGAVIGDVLHNLRSTLDHLAYRLFLIGNPSGDPRHVYFPIFSDLAKYTAGLKMKVRGMRQDAIDAIDALKPYRGGNETLWRLHALNNIDKHRLLITGFSSYQFHSMTPSQRLKFAAGVAGGPERLRGVFIEPVIGRVPLKAGMELLRIPESDTEEDLKFRIVIAFHEPAILDGEPVVETLNTMAESVSKIVADFELLLS